MEDYGQGNEKHENIDLVSSPPHLSLLQEILDTIRNSDLFSQRESDTRTSFWKTYERVAKQHDDEFLERHNNDLDVLLLFAGLFSAVSSAFIVDMGSDIRSDPSDTTNVLLKILAHTINNNTFSAEDLILPTWTGPGSTTVWIQSVAYASLSTSLLAAFGAVLGKQWLSQFKLTRFGRGALEEGCRERQLKIRGLRKWHFDALLDALPILLQLSLLFFGVALAARMWLLNRTLGGIILGTTAFGVLFYSFTFLAALIFEDCPFESRSSTYVRRLSIGTFGFARNYADMVLTSLGNGWKSLHSVVVTIGPTTSVWRRRRAVSSDAESHTVEMHLSKNHNDVSISETSGISVVSKGSTVNEEYINLVLPESPKDTLDALAIQWILQNSTDPEIITSTAAMIPCVEWPYHLDVSPTYQQLENILRSCFNRHFQVIPHMRERAFVCFKALTHLYFEEHLEQTIESAPSLTLPLPWLVRHIHLLQSHPDQSVLMVYAMMGIYRQPHSFDWSYVSTSDIAWLSHMLPYAIGFHKEHCSNIPDICFQVITNCLSDPRSSQAALTDSFLATGLIFRPNMDKRFFVKVDKSHVYFRLRRIVLHDVRKTLDFRRSIPDLQLVSRALKLLTPLPLYFENLPQTRDSAWEAVDLIDWGVRVCLFALRESPDFRGRDFIEDVQPEDLKEYARSALRLSIIAIIHWTRETDHTTIWRLPRTLKEYRSPHDFQPLIPYLIELCRGRDSVALGDALLALSSMDWSTSSLDRRPYIEALIQSMDGERPARVRHAALKAGWVIRADLASIEDESRCAAFSSALCDAVRTHEDTGYLPQTFDPDAFLYDSRDICYLRLLCTLSQKTVWRSQLREYLHYDRCVKIAIKIQSLSNSSVGVASGRYTVYLAYLFSIIDDRDTKTGSTSLPYEFDAWPLVLNAWKALAVEGPYWFEQMSQDYTGGHQILAHLCTYTSSFVQAGNSSGDIQVHLENITIELSKFSEGNKGARRVEKLNDLLERLANSASSSFHIQNIPQSFSTWTTSA